MSIYKIIDNKSGYFIIMHSFFVKEMKKSIIEQFGHITVNHDNDLFKFWRSRDFENIIIEFLDCSFLDYAEGFINKNGTLFDANKDNEFCTNFNDKYLSYVEEQETKPKKSRAKKEPKEPKIKEPKEPNIKKAFNVVCNLEHHYY